MTAGHRTTIQVKTFKARGRLLSRLAHDLLLRLHDFDLSFDAGQVKLVFAPASLVVEGAVVEGNLSTRVLSERHKTEIRANIQDTVLHTERHPEGRFEGVYADSENGVRVEGTLFMHGRQHPVDFELRANPAGFEGVVELIPSRWGVEPFSAMMGTLRLEDRVAVQISLLNELG